MIPPPLDDPRQDDLSEENDKLKDFLASRGYSRCNIPACNCGSFHGGHADERLRELSDYIKEHGMWQGTILASVKFVFRAYGIDEEVL